MDYALRPAETVERGVRRIAAGLLRRAERDLAQQPPHEAHHRIRKACKKMRALLRLVREPIGATFSLENQWYRDLARTLAGVRDAQAVIEAWEWLAEQNQGLPDALRCEVLDSLVRRRDELAAALAPAPADLRERIGEARQRARKWQVEADGFGAIAPGLRRSYRRALQAMRQARAEPNAVTLHHWRRRAKDHWYHMRLIDGFWPLELRARTRALAQLTDDLGRYHDLAVLRTTLAEVDTGASALPSVEPLIQRAEQRLAGGALAWGEHLFAERPKHFAARVRVHHDAWRTGAQSG